MTVSSDYETDSHDLSPYKGLLKGMDREISLLIDGDIALKTIQIDICFQRLEPGFLWGKVARTKNYVEQREYPIPPVNNLRDTEMMAVLKKKLEVPHPKDVLEALKDIIQLLSSLEPDKYPGLFSMLYPQVTNALKSLNDKELLETIKEYKDTATLFLSKNDPEKIFAEMLSKLSPESPASQSLLAGFRSKISETQPQDLYFEMRTGLINILHAMIAKLKMEKQEHEELEATLQLPMDSEKVRQLMAPLRKKILADNKRDEVYKLVQCYKQAARAVEYQPGEKKLLSVNIKLLYIKRSDPGREFVYEKKFPNPSVEV